MLYVFQAPFLAVNGKIHLIIEFICFTLRQCWPFNILCS
nr:MAG TPA: hypothetical protein [Caudoviricetes sp.]